MSAQTICDECGEPIDPTVAYYSATVQQLQEVDGAMSSIGAPLQRDYHVEHLPGGSLTSEGDADG